MNVQRAQSARKRKAISLDSLLNYLSTAGSGGKAILGSFSARTQIYYTNGMIAAAECSENSRKAELGVAIILGTLSFIDHKYGLGAIALLIDLGARKGYYGYRKATNPEFKDPNLMGVIPLQILDETFHKRKYRSTPDDF